MMKTTMKVGDSLEYEIEFVPHREGVRSIAKRFCEQRMSDFGISTENLASCLEPVTEYLDKVVEQRRKIGHERGAGESRGASKVADISVPLRIGEDEFIITYAPTDGAASEMAVRFCKEKGSTFGISEDNFQTDCVIPIGDYLRRSIPEVASDDILPSQPAILNDVEVSMKIGEKIFDLAWNSKYNSAENMARQFCLQHADTSLNIAVEDCIPPVQNHLLKAGTPIDYRRRNGKMKERKAEKKAGPELVKARIKIAGEEYEFRYQPTKEDATKKAIEFCRETGPSLGVEEDTMDAQCVEPIVDTLIDAIDLVSTP
jgi:hypothetical protein